MAKICRMRQKCNTHDKNIPCRPTAHAFFSRTRQNKFTHLPKASAEAGYFWSIWYKYAGDGRKKPQSPNLCLIYHRVQQKNDVPGKKNAPWLFFSKCMGYFFAESGQNLMGWGFLQSVFVNLLVCAQENWWTRRS
jgi:hypothetical protein